MYEGRLAEPWRSFLAEVDAAIDEPTDLHCIGGFVVSQYFGIARETADLDILAVCPHYLIGRLVAISGKSSPLFQKHRVYVEYVAVASYPEDYEARLIRIFPLWRNLKLWALEAHDLALTKLERSNDRDLRDVLQLASRGFLNRQTLRDRYEKEMRPYLIGRTPTWHDDTLAIWLDSWPKDAEA
jgi:Nucleotidyltransferase of unknown function (DUF6036)